MPIFVIHEHAAKKLHYDLRLEMKQIDAKGVSVSVLKSWAVPKEPPKGKGIKRLAIQVEDHVLSYAKFEGIIAEGYGKGTVKIWDKGKYELIDRKPGKIVFLLKGKKLKGEYVLLKFQARTEKDKGRTWLLFRK